MKLIHQIEEDIKALIGTDIVEISVKDLRELLKLAKLGEPIEIIE